MISSTTPNVVKLSTKPNNNNNQTPYIGGFSNINNPKMSTDLMMGLVNKKQP